MILDLVGGNLFQFSRVSVNRHELYGYKALRWKIRLRNMSALLGRHCTKDALNTFNALVKPYCTSPVFWNWINRTSFSVFYSKLPFPLLQLATQWHNKWKSDFLHLQTYLPECRSSLLPLCTLFSEMHFTFISWLCCPQVF